MKKLILAILIFSAFSPVCMCMDEVSENMLSYYDFTEVQKNSGGFDFFAAVKRILNGEQSFDIPEIMKELKNRIVGQTAGSLKTLSVIFAAALLCALSENISDSFKASENARLFIFLAVIAIYGTKILLECVTDTKTALDSMLLLTNSVYPIMLTYIAAGGGACTSAALHPVLLVCGSSIILAVKSLLIPAFSAGLALKTADLFSSDMHAGRISDLIGGFVKWAMGIMMTIFVGAVTITGVTAKTFDSITIRTAKYAIGSFIPMVGGVISDSFDLILNGSAVIKSSVGIAGLIGILYIAVTPCIKLAATALAFNICSAVCEPVCGKKLSDAIGMFGKAALTLFGITCAAASMFILSIGVLTGLKA